jgi:ATP-binding cassette subfamily F protein 3
MTQLAFAGVGVDFGDTTLFSNVSCTVAPGERWGIVGPQWLGEDHTLPAADGRSRAHARQHRARSRPPRVAARAALYTRPDGAAKARELGAELETLKRDLDAALERWTLATEQVEMRS